MNFVAMETNMNYIIVSILSGNKRQRKPKEQLRIDNPDTQATQDTRQRKAHTEH